jgi:peptidoglycan/LPS O-acetylase OafA/YrhL
MLLVGCGLALLHRDPTRRSLLRRFENGWLALAALGLAFVFAPFARAKLHGVFSSIALSLEVTLTALSIGVIVLFVTERPNTIIGRILNSRILRHLGVISYSLYLWQQLFTAYSTRFGPAIYLMILAAAELSYWFIEKPAMRLRVRLGL